MNTSVSTEVLVERARQGDQAAFGMLVERYRERLRGFVHTRMGVGVHAESDADDIAQETSLRALEALEEFQWQGEPLFFRWLCGIAKNAILHSATRRKRREALGVKMKEKSSASPSRVMRRDERFERLEDAFSQLPAEQRDVLRLARLEGLTFPEIARRLDRRPDAVRQIAVRALRRLRELFGDTESLGLPDRVLRLEEPGGVGEPHVE